MTKRRQKLIASFIFLFVVWGSTYIVERLNPKHQVLSVKIVREEATVARVIDGDTIEVLMNGQKEKVRVIGINTPETVDPRKKVECFGEKSSQKAKDLMNGQKVLLTPDPTQQNRDKYSRLLRYVDLGNEIDFGLRMISEGFAYEYTYDIPYTRQDEYKKAQREAESKKLGLWGGECE